MCKDSTGRPGVVADCALTVSTNTVHAGVRKDIPEICDMSLGDIDVVLEIGSSEQYFSVSEEPGQSTGFWSRETLERWVLSESDISLVAKSEDRIIGFALTTVHFTNRKAECENIWVDPKWHGAKVGQALVECTIARIHESDSADVIIALVDDNNRAGQDFFQNRMGFTRGKSHVWLTRRIAD
ncbi:MAG: GNAT family N-acetyltransferase [Candidatus Moraniibacteriota bacterium]